MDTRVKDINIKGVYLFGSVARGDFDRDSDVDLFIDIGENDEERINEIIKTSEKQFYKSDSYKKYGFLGIKNQIKALSGDLEKWELKESVEKDGIILYSSSVSKGLIKYFVVIIKPIKDVRGRNFVMRALSGRKEKYYKKSGGFLKEIGVEQLDSRVFLVPAEKINRILRLFSKQKVNYKLLAIWK